MTVTGIWDWALLNAKKIDVSEIRKKTLAIDGHIWLYESVRGSQTHYKVESTYLITFFKRCMKLIEQKIKPIVVFDSLVAHEPSTSVGSQESFCARKQRRSGGDPFNNFSDKVLKCQALLRRMGVHIVFAPRDGEAQCAQLEIDGIVDGCITTDFDYFLFGGRNLYRIQFDDNLKNITHISMKSIELEKKIHRKGLISLAILLGCDYYEKGVKGIGIVTGVEAVTQFTFLHDDDPTVILDRFTSYVRGEIPERPDDSEVKLKLRRRKFNFSQEFPNSEDVREAVNVYLQPQTTRFEKEKFKDVLEQNMVKVEEILSRECGWTPERMNKELKKSQRKSTLVKEEITQKRIPDYFYTSKRRYQPVVEPCTVEEYIEENRKYTETKKRRVSGVVGPKLPKKRGFKKSSMSPEVIQIEDSDSSSVEVIQID